VAFGPSIPVGPKGLKGRDHQPAIKGIFPSADKAGSPRHPCSLDRHRPARSTARARHRLPARRLSDRDGRLVLVVSRPDMPRRAADDIRGYDLRDELSNPGIGTLPSWRQDRGVCGGLMLTRKGLADFRCQFPARRQEFRCRARFDWARKLLTRLICLMKRRQIPDAGKNFSLLSGTIPRRRAAAGALSPSPSWAYSSGPPRSPSCLPRCRLGG
jgi:hypothetical protein